MMDENSRELAVANNNSMCSALYYSSEFGPKCAEFCGKAFEAAHEAGKTVGYKCHAGLECRAVPMENEESKRVVIVGRAFVKSENYRIATGRVIEGDWQGFDAGEFFENVLIEGSTAEFEEVSKRITKAREDDLMDIFVSARVEPVEEPKRQEKLSEMIERFNDEKPAAFQKGNTGELILTRALLGSLRGMQYTQARRSVLEHLAKNFGITSVTWFERHNGHLRSVLAWGTMKQKPVRLKIAADEPRLLEAAKTGRGIELKQRSADTGVLVHTVDLFPVAVDGEIRCAVAIGDQLVDLQKKEQLVSFFQAIAPEFETLWLREEVRRRTGLTRAIRRFNDSLKGVDRDDFWLGLTQLSAEMLQAERASLLVANEKSGELFAKAAIGTSADLTDKNVGRRVASKIFEKGAPLLVPHLENVGLTPAAADRRYKTDSFLSYPLTIGGRKIAILNFTDKADGRSFEEADLELINSIAPQMALAIDRAILKDKAGEYAQLSVTDSMTGLLNRRYLEERLAEEIIRSNRHGYPMSFMMIDVDHFKSYNDTFGHPEGDKALKMVGHVLKDTLRGADVAARYGGEEFSILLPQTTSEEAYAIAERIRKRIENTDFVNRKVTVSMGIASCSLELNSPEDVITAADKALYEAKRRGRNNVQIYERMEPAEAGLR